MGFTITLEDEDGDLLMSDLINELYLVMEKAESDKERDLVREILNFCIQCKESVHLYVKFYGD